MTCYAESSAVLAWLLDEARRRDVAMALASADTITTSDLTLVEVDRALLRLTSRGALAAARADDLRRQFGAVSLEWAIVPIAGAVIERARLPMPEDAIRTLDAIHLATAVVVAASVPDLEVVSLDERIRSNAIALGFRVLPD